VRESRLLLQGVRGSHGVTTGLWELYATSRLYSVGAMLGEIVWENRVHGKYKCFS
jgi:hypothetical protein